jgi:hypothetical protein
LITNETVIPVIIFSAFYICSFEDSVCSEIGDHNTIEHYRLSQCDRTQVHTEEVQRKQRVQTQIPHYGNLDYGYDYMVQLIVLRKSWGGYNVKKN